jgi:hypothetical protein
MAKEKRPRPSTTADTDGLRVFPHEFRAGDRVTVGGTEWEVAATPSGYLKSRWSASGGPTRQAATSALDRGERAAGRLLRHEINAMLTQERSVEGDGAGRERGCGSG